MFGCIDAVSKRYKRFGGVGQARALEPTVKRRPANASTGACNVYWMALGKRNNNAIADFEAKLNVVMVLTCLWAASGYRCGGKSLLDATAAHSEVN